MRHKHPASLYFIWVSAKKSGKITSAFSNAGECFSEAEDCNLIITQHIQLPVLMQFRIITWRNIFCSLPKSKAATEQFKWEGCPLRKQLHVCNIFQILLQIKIQIGIYCVLMFPLAHIDIVFSWINYQKYFDIIIGYYMIEKSWTVEILGHIYKLQNY